MIINLWFIAALLSELPFWKINQHHEIHKHMHTCPAMTFETCLFSEPFWKSSGVFGFYISKTFFFFYRFVTKKGRQLCAPPATKNNWVKKLINKLNKKSKKSSKGNFYLILFLFAFLKKNGNGGIIHHVFFWQAHLFVIPAGKSQ